VAPRRRIRLSRWIVPTWAGLVYAFLYLPILVIVLFSFDESKIPGLPLERLTLDWYSQAVNDQELLDGLRNTIVIALAVGLISTLVGLAGARELARRTFPGKGLLLMTLLAPLVVPPIVLGIGLLTMFDALGIELSRTAVVIAHCVFGISFSTLIIYSRLSGFRESLLEAARDLGANEWRVFREVVLPLVMPALMASFLLSFTLSFDEFIVAWLVIGFDTTLPVSIWNALRYGITPEINAIATLVILASLLLSLVGQLLAFRRV
jgi:spermidine/putrescine transport system permease protein